MNSITTSFSSSSQNISYAALGVAAVALVSSLTSIALIIFTKIRLDAANKKTVPSSETDDKRITDLNKRLASLEGTVTQLTQQISRLQQLFGQHHQILTSLLKETERLGNFSSTIERFSHLALTSTFPASAQNKNFYTLIDHYCNNTTKTPCSIPYMRIIPSDQRRNIDNSTYRDVTISELQISIEEQEMHLVISHGSFIQNKVKMNLTFAQIETILFEEPKT